MNQDQTILRKGRLARLAVVLLILASVQAVPSAQAETALEPSPPHYELTLEFQEFSVLHSAIRSAINHYGSEAAFTIRMASEEGAVRWHVTLPNPQTMAAVKTWVSEMTTELVSDWLEHSGNRKEIAALEEINADAIRAATADRLREMAQLGNRVLPTFAKLCRSRADR